MKDKGDGSSVFWGGGVDRDREKKRGKAHAGVKVI